MSNAFAGFLGALIGAGASLIGLIIQQHYQTKRERIKIAADLGLSDFKSGFELACKQGGTMVPVSAYVIYHARLLEEMSKGKIDPKKIKELNNEFIELIAAISETK